jgi:phosphotriesterase-related protein
VAGVQTVRGPVEVERLGPTLMHEHVFVLGAEMLQNYPGYPDHWDEQARVADAVTKLTELKRRGIDTIVDPTVIGLGRYLHRIQRINEQVDVNIIEEQVLTPGVERVMRAVGQAQVETGVPITVHTHPHTHSGLVAQKVLAEEGAGLTKVVIGHSGDTNDLAYLRALADAGSYLGMDRFGLDVLLSFEQRVDTVAELARLGHAEKMVLAHDASCFTDWFPEAKRTAAAPNWHYTHISDDVLPALRARGVSEEQITTMLVDNPRRYFGG